MVYLNGYRLRKFMLEELLTQDFIAGVGWGALLYESIQVAGRLLLIKFTGMELSKTQKTDLLDDGQLNDSVDGDDE